MQNDEYYELYMKEWQKMLGQKEKPTDAEMEELKKQMQKDETDVH